MAYPEFPEPMFRDLKEVSEDYLLPGVEEIPRETFGALSTNPQFIESFMTGLNHEMADELLWRGFPTDRRGSYFRQFWDPSARVPKPDDPDDLKDVTELHRWDDKTTSELGSNVMTGAGGAGSQDPGQTAEPTTNVVVVIRGELLRRYPQTTIYATKAKCVDRTDGRGSERVPEWASQAETDDAVDTDRVDDRLQECVVLGAQLGRRAFAGICDDIVEHSRAGGRPAKTVVHSCRSN